MGETLAGSRGCNSMLCSHRAAQYACTLLGYTMQKGGAAAELRKTVSQLEAHMSLTRKRKWIACLSCFSSYNWRIVTDVFLFLSAASGKLCWGTGSSKESRTPLWQRAQALPHNQPSQQSHVLCMWQCPLGWENRSHLQTGPAEMEWEIFQVSLSTFTAIKALIVDPFTLTFTVSAHVAMLVANVFTQIHPLTHQEQ